MIGNNAGKSRLSFCCVFSISVFLFGSGHTALSAQTPGLLGRMCSIWATSKFPKLDQDILGSAGLLNANNRQSGPLLITLKYGTPLQGRMSWNERHQIEKNAQGEYLLEQAGGVRIGVDPENVKSVHYLNWSHVRVGNVYLNAENELMRVVAIAPGSGSGPVVTLERHVFNSVSVVSRDANGFLADVRGRVFRESAEGQAYIQHLAQAQSGRFFREVGQTLSKIQKIQRAQLNAGSTRVNGRTRLTGEYFVPEVQSSLYQGEGGLDGVTRASLPAQVGAWLGLRESANSTARNPSFELGEYHFKYLQRAQFFGQRRQDSESLGRRQTQIFTGVIGVNFGLNELNQINAHVLNLTVSPTFLRANLAELLNRVRDSGAVGIELPASYDELIGIGSVRVIYPGSRRPSAIMTAGRGLSQYLTEHGGTGNASLLAFAGLVAPQVFYTISDNASQSTLHRVRELVEDGIHGATTNYGQILRNIIGYGINPETFLPIEVSPYTGPDFRMDAVFGAPPEGRTLSIFEEDAPLEEVPVEEENVLFFGEDGE